MTDSAQATILQRLFTAAVLLLFSVSSPAQEPPSLSATVLPVTTQLPANTLRVYIQFSKPMRRGQASTHLRFEDDKGNEITSPLLNLGTELWNNDQTRLTLLFDPGRLKQGVGPNVRYGPPLAEGEVVSVVVSGSMMSVNGDPLGKAHQTHWLIGAAERRPIAPETWNVRAPERETSGSLVVSFDRLIDPGAAIRLMRIRAANGKFVDGQADCDGKTWTFNPTRAWSEAGYEIVIHPSLEDVAGNTPLAAFDQMPGAESSRKALTVLPFTPVAVSP